MCSEKKAIEELGRSDPAEEAGETLRALFKEKENPQPAQVWRNPSRKWGENIPKWNREWRESRNHKSPAGRENFGAKQKKLGAGQNEEPANLRAGSSPKVSRQGHFSLFPGVYKAHLIS